MHTHTYLSLNCGGKLLEWQHPVIMGIVNVTPDSFFSGSRIKPHELISRVGKMVDDGVDIVDIGGYSTRPGATDISAAEELSRLLPAISKIREMFPDLPISVDTFRANVAEECISEGADMINDIGGGDMDPDMFGVIAKLKVPYILMHTKGTPETMNRLTDYEDVTAEVLSDLAFKADRLYQMGVADVIIDPGFGFAKTLDQNYSLLGNLKAFRKIGPVLAGLSRKSMIYKELEIAPNKALNGSTALNMLALANGASILRVHDVKEAVQTARLFEAYRRNLPEMNRLITVASHDSGFHAEIY